MESECMQMAFKRTFMGFAVQCLSGHPLPADEREQGRPAVRDHRAGRRARADHHRRWSQGSPREEELIMAGRPARQSLWQNKR